MEEQEEGLSLMDRANIGQQLQGYEPLSDREKSYIDFEAKWDAITPGKHPGEKENDIMDTFDHGATRYYQILGAVIDKPGALDHNPMLVKRLLQRRAIRRDERSVKRAQIKLPGEE